MFRSKQNEHLTPRMRRDDPSLTIVVSASAGDVHSPGKASSGGTSSATTTVILTIVNLIYG